MLVSKETNGKHCPSPLRSVFCGLVVREPRGCPGSCLRGQNAVGGAVMLTVGAEGHMDRCGGSSVYCFPCGTPEEYPTFTVCVPVKHYL